MANLIARAKEYSETMEGAKISKIVVSVIVPVYNCSESIELCVNSILKQTYELLEIILVDDGSTDDSLALCNKLSKRDRRIKVLSKKNDGVSSARNFGLEEARGEYVFFLDADDTIDDGVIEGLVDNYKKHELVGSNVRLVRESNSRILKRKEKYDRGSLITDILADNLQGFVWGYLFIKDLCPRFDEGIGYCEDMVFLIDYLINNDINRITFPKIGDCYYNYYQNDDSVTLSRSDIVRKLGYINSAMRSLLDKVGDDYAELVDNKKLELFEAEMQHANKHDIRKAMELFELPQHYCSKGRARVFLSLYQRKMVSGILLYYRVRRIIKKPYSWVKNMGCRSRVVL